MIQKVIEYKNLLSNLGELMENSPYKKKFIIREIGISAPTFYRKLKSLAFTPDETLSIIRIITPEDAYLHDLKESILKGKQDYEKGKTYTRNEVIEDIKELLK
jgi:hypothetical protein